MQQMGTNPIHCEERRLDRVSILTLFNVLTRRTLERYKFKNMVLNLPPLTNLNKFISANNNNRYAAASIKRNETELVAWKCREQNAPKLKKLHSLEFIWRCKDKRQDKDNICFAKKFILDGMVMAGVIPNDTYSLLPDKIIDRFEIGEPGVVVVFK
jgi:hypothetical protein